MPARKLEHYKKSDKKALVVDIAKFDSHSEQCFCSTPKNLSKVFPDFLWQIYIFSKQLSASKPYLEHLPPLLAVGNIEMF